MTSLVALNKLSHFPGDCSHLGRDEVSSVYIYTYLFTIILTTCCYLKCSH